MSIGQVDGDVRKIKKKRKRIPPDDQSISKRKRPCTAKHFLGLIGKKAGDLVQRIASGSATLTGAELGKLEKAKACIKDPVTQINRQFQSFVLYLQKGYPKDSCAVIFMCALGPGTYNIGRTTRLERERLVAEIRKKKGLYMPEEIVNFAKRHVHQWISNCLCNIGMETPLVVHRIQHQLEEGDAQNPRLSERPRSPTADLNPDADLTLRETFPPCSTNLSVANSTAMDPPSTINSHQAQVHSNASMEATEAMIPARTFSSIMRYPVNGQDKAGIQMTFPLRPSKLLCSITLEVKGDIIQDIASALFGVAVKSDGGLRSVLCPGGTEVFAHEGKVNLRNGKKQAMADVFGSEIAMAVETSPLFPTDTEDQDRTKCISMSISSNLNQTAFLSLSLGLAKGTQISEKLYS
ncbi:hypothetical protein BCR34DRAFT_608970 [Clohesyomyces aquaticus]|uniref:Uncharacterized protein n=1 Tax=Clohesyomyces aquaticus TaxID=1231657 RepID=A0A1Y1Y0U3_9PLEO|nr:hypothetical protein BCR34DRAFT_608970 [Clohesyomyces aquaticus]